jgi:hypothetical protein
MAQTVMIPGGGATVGTVTYGTTASPTFACGEQVSVLESQVNPQYVQVPPTAGLPGRQVYIGTQRSLRLSFMQDWGPVASTSFCKFLEDNEGDEIYVEFTPLGTTLKWLYKVQAVPVNEGGTMGQVAMAETTLPVVTRTPTYS